MIGEVPSARVVSVSPLTVSIGGGTAVSAVALHGQSLAVDDRGFVLYTASRTPLFLKS